MAEKSFYVYMYLRQASSINGAKGTPYYVGKGSDDRAYVKHTNVPTPKDRERIVTVADGMSEPDAMQVEVLFVYLHGRLDIATGCLRNRTHGGQGMSGAVHSDETKRRLSFSKLGEKNPAYGTKASPGTRAKMSASQRKTIRTMSDWHRQRLKDLFTGKPLSLEHRAKLSDAQRRRAPRTQEQRAAISRRHTLESHPRWLENPSKRTLQKRVRVAARKAALAAQQ